MLCIPVCKFCRKKGGGGGGFYLKKNKKPIIKKNHVQNSLLFALRDSKITLKSGGGGGQGGGGGGGGCGLHIILQTAIIKRNQLQNAFDIGMHMLKTSLKILCKGFFLGNKTQ